MTSLSRRLAAEALGTAILSAAVIGSGIMAERLTGDGALALLCNAIATGAVLVVLITVLAPVSGAQFNPVVSLVAALSDALPIGETMLYALAQVAGGVAGTVLVHAMFGVPLLEVSQHARSGAGLLVSEGVATFGLIFVILGSHRARPEAVAWLVGLYITAAYWFTASTSFANPALTLARALTDTFAGVRPGDVPGFIVAQAAGAVVAFALSRWLWAARSGAVTPPTASPPSTPARPIASASPRPAPSP